jgi:hypothetical protein
MATYHLSKVPWKGTLVRWTLKVPPCYPTLDPRPAGRAHQTTPPMDLRRSMKKPVKDEFEAKGRKAAPDDLHS